MEENKINNTVENNVNVAEIEKEIIEDKSGKASLDEAALLQERKEKVIKFLRTRYNWVTYIALAIIIYIAVKIRTSNTPLLKDITTGTWTLGPDLDPFLFLRWAKYIVENGTLYAIDTMRYVPLGYNIKGELLLHPYMMAWFHKIAVFFGSESVTHSAVLYPAFMFALTLIAFFLFTRQVFIKSMGSRKANIIGLIASFFLSVTPVLLPRTIAGIPEKESVAFLFMFLALYFFLLAFNSNMDIPVNYATKKQEWTDRDSQTKSTIIRNLCKLKKGILFAVLAGASTAGMALVWGGYGFIFLTIAPAVLAAFFLGKMDMGIPVNYATKEQEWTDRDSQTKTTIIGNLCKSRLLIYAIWIISSFVLMFPFSTRYAPLSLLISIMTGSSVVVFVIILFNFSIFNPYLKKYFSNRRFAKVPPKISSTIVVLFLLFIIVLVTLGPSFIIGETKNVIGNLISTPPGRILQTVAENRQPFFNEWSGSFGPFFKGIPVSFWLFFIGSIYLFYKMIHVVKGKPRLALTLFYALFLFAVVFSKYSPESTLNGSNNTSLALYALGFAAFIGALSYYYFSYYKQNELDKLKNIEFGLILVFVLFFFSIVSARGAVRLILMLTMPASIIISYFVVASSSDAIKSLKAKEDIAAVVLAILAGIVILGTIFSGYQFYKQVSAEARGYAPSIYTQQWQKAMAWVRENTPRDAVFGHWWDYGYWLQSIGERATVLDGGNAIGYWNHLMGRHALTGTSNKDALEYLYAHNTTHFLIDSTDIGKYGAFSSIGSNKDYDRRSWISTFIKDSNQVRETKNSTIYLYSGGSVLDSDIIYDNNGSRIFLPAGAAGIGAVLIEKNSAGEIVSQPIGIYVYQNAQYRLPLRYAFANGKFVDYEKGVEAGAFLFPRVDQNMIDMDGAMLYLSDRTVRSQLARLYLYKEDNPYFKLVHSEDDFVVVQIKAQNPNIGDIVFFNGLRGPIRIWEINYPDDIEFKEKYLLTVIPKEEGFEL